MLEQMQKHMNWIMWTILVLVIVSFLFFGIFPATSSRGAAAKVNGDVITSNELNRAYQNMVDTYRQILKDKFSDAMAKNLRIQALRELVQDRLLVQEANRVGIRVSDDEVRASIMQIPAFQAGGAFNQEAYHRYLDYVNVKPGAFEEQQRDSLVLQKFERIIEDGVDVTDGELKDAFAKRHPKAKAGEFEKERASLRESVLNEKKRDALEAFVMGLYKKSDVKMYAAEGSF